MQLTVKKILYATDLSKNSAHAFLYAADYAEKHNARIVILYVLEALRWGDRTFLEDSQEITEQFKVAARNRENLIQNIKKRLDDFCRKVQKNEPACNFNVERIEVSEGYPANTILEKSEEFDCDLIVMGTHGKGRITHAFLGSVAEKVLRRSRRPVLTIPLPEEETELSFHD